MRSSLVVRASDCQCTSCNGPGFRINTSIRLHNRSWGAADDAVLNIVRNVWKKPLKNHVFTWTTQTSVADPWHFGTDLDPRISTSDWSGSCYFRQWPSKRQVFFLITFWRYIYIIFQRKNVIKKSHKSRNQGFSNDFCLMILGSGSRRPKYMRILRIRIRNTDANPFFGPFINLLPTVIAPEHLPDTLF